MTNNITYYDPQSGFIVIGYNSNGIVLSANSKVYYYNVEDVEGLLLKYSYPVKGGRVLKTDLINYLKPYEVNKEDWNKY